MPKPKSPDEILAALKANAAYAHIDIDRELGKATAWCMTNRRQCTPRFFVNWLNRIDPPLRPGNPGILPAAIPEPIDPICPHCGAEYCLKAHREEI